MCALLSSIYHILIQRSSKTLYFILVPKSTMVPTIRQVISALTVPQLIHMHSIGLKDDSAHPLVIFWLNANSWWTFISNSFSRINCGQQMASNILKIVYFIHCTAWNTQTEILAWRKRKKEKQLLISIWWQIITLQPTLKTSFFTILIFSFI